MVNRTIKSTLASIAVVAMLAGCGSSKPSTELISARAGYASAQESPAEKVVPDKLLAAEQALAEAERAYKKDPGSMSEKTLGYVAVRIALMAVAYAGVVEARADTMALQRAYKEELENRRRTDKSKLATTRDSLGRTQADLDRAKAELEAREKELERKRKVLATREKELTKSKTDLKKSKEDLERERKARQEAEAKAAAALASLEEIAKIKEESRGLVITLSGAVLFKSGHSSLLPIAERQLGKVAEALLEQDEKKKIVIEGHTDSRGSDRRNRELSQRRADSVRTFLITRNVPAKRIIALGKGESQPIASNRSAEGRANNRRVEIIVRN